MLQNVHIYIITIVNMNDIIGICKLCQLERKLIKQSHIIPDFMYKQLIKESAKLMKYNQDGISGKVPVQTGIFEKYILCVECDTIRLNRWETVSSIFLYGQNIKNSFKTKKVITPDGLELVIANNAPYEQFKLMLLSIFWRIHIASNPFFKNGKMPEHHAEALRQMIMNEDAGIPSKYRVAAAALQAFNKDIIYNVAGPRYIPEANSLFFIAGGMLYMLELGPGGSESFFDRFHSRENNSDTIVMPILRGVLAYETLCGFMGEQYATMITIGRANHKPKL